MGNDRSEKPGRLREGAEILLVEESARDAELLLAALGEHAAKTFVATDGAEALDYAFGTGAYAAGGGRRSLNVILLGLKLPDMGGLEVLRRLKADERTRFVPVVVIASSRDEGEIAQSYRLGANSHIVKPDTAEALARAVSLLAR